MEVKGIIWVGSATDDLEATMTFFSKVLDMPIVTDVAGFARLSVANGDRLELFGPDSREHEQLDTGPVAGFWVDDVEVAREEMIQQGVCDLTDLTTGRDGHRWFYFRAPDGNFYEMCEQPGPREPATS